MRSFILKVLCFVLLVLGAQVVLIGLGATAGPTLQRFIRARSNIPLGLGRKHVTLRFDELRGVTDLDILFIGSSHCLRTFDPRYFEDRGIQAFNLGTDMQTPLNTYYLLRRYLTQLNPQLVVLEVGWLALANNGVEGTLFITANHGPNWDTLRMALATHHPMAVNAQLARQFEKALGRTTEIRMNPNEVYTSGGFVERWDPNTNKLSSQRNWIVNNDQLRYLSRSLSLLREHDVKALLVWAPVTSEYRERAANLEDIRRRLVDFSDTHNVPFIDLNNRVPLDDRLDFFNSDHLNQRGVDKVMPVFASLLSDLHLLPKKRTPSSSREALDPGFLADRSWTSSHLARP